MNAKKIFPENRFSLVMDNAQIQVKARHQGLTHQNRMRTWVLAFAAKNRALLPSITPQLTIPAMSIPLERSVVLYSIKNCHSFIVLSAYC
jgi:hypothetical protein